MVFKTLIAFGAVAQLAFGATIDPGVTVTTTGFVATPTNVAAPASVTTSSTAAVTNYNPNYANSFAETSWPQNPAIRYPGSHSSLFFSFLFVVPLQPA